MGALCKPPVYRSTPFGREICDLMLAVNRAFGKSDYIPCIAWGRNAQYAARFRVGDRLRVTGRLQSREYQKLLDNGEYMVRTWAARKIGYHRMEYINRTGELPRFADGGRIGGDASWANPSTSASSSPVIASVTDAQVAVLAQALYVGALNGTRAGISGREASQSSAMRRTR